MIEKNNSSNPRSDTKEKIFNAAAKLFSNEGYYRVSVREICEEAGVAKPALYYYFKDKESLVKELVDDVHKMMDDLKERHLPKQGSFLEIIDGIIAIYKDMAEYQSHFIKFAALTQIMAVPDGVKKARAERAKAEFEAIERVFYQGVQEGYVAPKINYKMLSKNFVGHLWQIVIEYLIYGENKETLNEQLDGFRDFWFAAFLKNETEIK